MQPVSPLIGRSCQNTNELRLRSFHVVCVKGYPMHQVLLRTKQVFAYYPKSRAGIYNDINAGTFPPPIKLGERCSAWLREETEIVVAARAAQLTDDQVRGVVRDLVDARSYVDAPARRQAILGKHLGSAL